MDGVDLMLKMVVGVLGIVYVPTRVLRQSTMALRMLLGSAANLFLIYIINLFIDFIMEYLINLQKVPVSE